MHLHNKVMRVNSTSSHNYGPKCVGSIFAFLLEIDKKSSEIPVWYL